MPLNKRQAGIKKPVRVPFQTPLMANRPVESHVYQQIFLQVNEKIRHERELASLERRKEELTARLTQIRVEMTRLQALLEQSDRPFLENGETGPVPVRTVGLQYGGRRGRIPTVPLPAPEVG